MNKKFISIILLMAIVFADISMINPQKSFANDNSDDVEYNQEEISDVYIDDVQQAVSAPIAAATYAAAKSGSWIKASNGKWWYKHSDGTYTKNDWEYIDGKWYHFESNGYMQTGWLKVDGYWYHLDYDTGAMAIGWKYINGEYYYFNSSGIRQVGWLKDGNYWYHLDYETGIMAIGWKYINGEYYYFNSSGIRQVGWLKDGSYWYYLNSDGIMQTGWLKLYGEWYYFESDGVRHCGWLDVNGKTYYLNSDGIMQTGWLTLYGERYFFDSEGVRKTGWLEYKNDWYYFNNDGIMQTGWHKINGGWYYLNSSGKMNTKKMVDGTRTYYFLKEGDFKGKLKSTELSVNIVTQKKDSLCWAACSVMVGTYNTDSKRNQNDIVKYIKGSSEYSAGNIADEIKAIEYASYDSKKAYYNISPDYYQSIESIDNNCPFIVNMSYVPDKTSQKLQINHAYVCSGYDIEIEKIRLIDPLNRGKTSYEDKRMLTELGVISNRDCLCLGTVNYRYK